MSIIKFNFEKNSKIKINFPDNCQKEKIEENIGNSKNDFIPLTMIGEANYGTILIVKSKINNKNYIMKIIKKDPSDPSHREVEKLILKKLNHPNIIKYYSSFEDNINYYIIIEYIIGPNLYDFYLYNKIKRKFIEEEVIWDLLGQCLEALVYIHGNAIIHRDIKMCNILIDKNMKLKIIDFNASAIMDRASAKEYINNNNITNIINKGTNIENGFEAPEMITKQYDAKVDVYSAGRVFYELCNINNNIYNNYYQYSNELFSIINEMLMKDPNSRKTSNEIYILFKKYYTIKYFKYSSIFSCLHCLFNYPIWEENFKTLKEYMKNNISKFFFDSFIKKKSQNFEEYIKEFKNNKLALLYDNNNKCKEIEPILLIKYILSKLNEELNTLGNVYVKLPEITRKIIKEEEYIKYKYKYKNLFDSIISQNFLGLLELRRQCRRCKKLSYFFNYFYYLSFDMEYLIQKKISINSKIIFNYLMKHITRPIICNSCEMKTDNEEAIKIFNVPNNLLLFFNRGQNSFTNNNKNTIIDFPEILILDSKTVEKFLDKNKNNPKLIYYYLNSILCQIYDNRGSYVYISFTRGKINGNNINNNNNTKYFNLNDIKRNFVIVGLLYYSNKQIINNYREGLPIYKINICKQNENLLNDIIINNNNNLQNNSNIINNNENINHNFNNDININNNNNIIKINNNNNQFQISQLRNNYFNINNYNQMNNNNKDNFLNTNINRNIDNNNLFNNNLDNIKRSAVYEQGYYNPFNDYNNNNIQNNYQNNNPNNNNLNNNIRYNNQNNYNNPNNNNPNNNNYPNNNNNIQINNAYIDNNQNNIYQNNNDINNQNSQLINDFINPENKILNCNNMNYEGSKGGSNTGINNSQNNNNNYNPNYQNFPNLGYNNQNNNQMYYNNQYNNQMYNQNNNRINQNNNRINQNNNRINHNNNMIYQNNNNMHY